MSRVFVESVSGDLNPDNFRQKLELTGCGSIVSFVGITRDFEGDDAVIKLEFDAWESKLKSTLLDLGNLALDKFKINSIVIAHRVGTVLPQQPIVSIHVASPHRIDGFNACSWLIDELKLQAPLWKKEIRNSGEYWKSGLG